MEETIYSYELKVGDKTLVPHEYHSGHYEEGKVDWLGENELFQVRSFICKERCWMVAFVAACEKKAESFCLVIVEPE